MGIKRIAAGVVLFLLIFPAVKAQEIKTDSIYGNIYDRNERTDVLQTSESEAEVKPYDEVYEKRMNEVWKRRAKYRNLSYGLQTLKSSHKDLKSDMAFGLTIGRTYYLHKKPIAGIMKFGLDWSYIDINFAKYPDFPASENSQPNMPDAQLADLSVMQIEAGMSIGPSLTINPVNQLKLSLYFRATPSYSLMMQNHELYHHYATFFNAGFTVAYKIISLGIETRWCEATNYDGVVLGRLDKVYDDEGNFHDPFESYATKLKTNTIRFFIGFRF